MCGRSAQTVHAVRAAAQSLGVNVTPAMLQSLGISSITGDNASGTQGSTSTGAVQSSASSTRGHEKSLKASDGSKVIGKEDSVDALTEQVQFQRNNNYNLSPGMDALVIHLNDKGEVQLDFMTWGLVTKGGTAARPLERSMKQHFDNLMYNARSDTLYDKITFSRLAQQGKSCLVAVDGFFEWKDDAGPGKAKKQPYFVYRKRDVNDAEPSYLLFPGLWTRVPTGHDRSDRGDDHYLDTFTIVTTEVCAPLRWLHTRMPVCIWDQHLAQQWLRAPSKKVHKQLEEAATATPEGYLGWHKVTKEMTSMKFRSAAALDPIPEPKTIKSFFAASPSKGKVSGTNDEIAVSKVAQPSKAPAFRSTTASTTVKSASDESGALKTSTPAAASIKKRPAPTSAVKSPPPKKQAVVHSDKKKKGPMDAFVATTSR